MVAVAHLVKGRLLRPADVHYMGTPGMEAATRWWRQIVRDSTRYAVGDSTARQPWDCFHQSPGVRVQWILKQFAA